MRAAPPDRRAVLVDTAAYGTPGLNWCEVIEIVGGTASAQPIRVRIPGGGVGTYAHDQVRDWRS